MEPDSAEPRWVAIGKQLRDVPGVRTLGVRATLNAYPQPDRELLLSGRKIYYPTRRFADLFQALGIPTFPGWIDYLCLGDKVRQTQLFQARGIPHPHTSIYAGPHAARRIREDFSFPFVLKNPLLSGGGRDVFLIRSPEELDARLAEHRRAYVQEFIPTDRDFRVVLIGGRIVAAYGRRIPEGAFHANLSQGGQICCEPVPEEVLRLAEETARRCGFDEVGLDLMLDRDRPVVIEANFRFGLRGVEVSGVQLEKIRFDLLRLGVV